jgi:hypothetical protein
MLAASGSMALFFYLRFLLQRVLLLIFWRQAKELPALQAVEREALEDEIGDDDLDAEHDDAPL